MAATKAVHVLIVGAGTTGLLIAQGLKKYGITFSIYEAESQDNYLNHQRDWSMALLWGAEYIKNTLPNHLMSRFDEIKTDRFYVPEVGHEQTMPFYNGKTGELVVRIPGGLATRVSRVKLRRLFAEDLQIEFEKRVANIQEADEQVTLIFTDGSSVTGDTVVFCDGVKSSAGRGLLLGQEQSQLEICDCSIVNITHRYTAEQASFIRGQLNPVFKFASHPEDETLFLLTTTDVPDLDKPQDWNFQCIFTTWGATAAATPEERMRIFKEQASKYAEPWRSAVQWLPEDKIIPRDRIKYWKNPTPWPTMNGTVTLAGDAAHPMVPFRAQGLNNAMRDSYGYVEALRKIVDGSASLDAAIGEYSNEVFARGAKEIAMSNGAGPLMHNWEMLMQSPLMKWSYERPPATKEAAADTTAVTQPVQPVQPIEQPKQEKEVAPVPAGEALANGQQVRRDSLVAESKSEPVEPTSLQNGTHAPQEAANGVNGEVSDKAQATKADSQPSDAKATVTAAPIAATEVAAAAHTEQVNGTRPTWESLYAENQKLRKMNEELVQKLLAVSKAFEGGISLDTAQAFLAGNQAVKV